MSDFTKPTRIVARFMASDDLLKDARVDDLMKMTAHNAVKKFCEKHGVVSIGDPEIHEDHDANSDPLRKVEGYVHYITLGWVIKDRRKVKM